MNRVFLPLLELQLSACCSHSCPAPALEALRGRDGEGGHWERMWTPYMAARREKAPSLPTPPARTVCKLFGHLPTSAPHILQLP